MEGAGVFVLIVSAAICLPSPPPQSADRQRLQMPNRASGGESREGHDWAFSGR